MIDQLKKKKINLNQVIRNSKESVQAIFNKKNINFVENYDPSLPNINGNEEQLIQLFVNLLKNSVEVIDKIDGIIKISSRYQHGKLPVKVFIEDSGVGISDKLKENIFDPFVTNKINGKGLGLSISAKIIQNHFGSIEFDTMNNRTIFTVMFDKINN